MESSRLCHLLWLFAGPCLVLAFWAVWVLLTRLVLLVLESMEGEEHEDE